MTRVCIIQPVMKHYRLPFFSGLESRLLRSGISLKVVYGTPWAEERERGDEGCLHPPLGCQSKGWMLPGGLYLQPVLRPWLSADLVIVEHANKHALNWLLLALRSVGLKRVAYWGHGRDRQGNPGSAGERFKRRSLHWADWWFAYTQGAADYIVAEGFDRTSVSVVENAIDTREVIREVASITDTEKGRLLAELGWGRAARVGVYCGSLYPNKRLDLLLQAALLVRATHPDFHLLIVGGGPSVEEVTEFSSRHSWVRYVGPKFGREKARFLSLADMALNPGLVGLGILDAFSARLPLLTTRLPIHSPEIEYLIDGQNGLMLGASERAYAAGITALLSDAVLLRQLQEGAAVASRRHSIEAMIENFARGIENCLAR